MKKIIISLFVFMLSLYGYAREGEDSVREVSAMSHDEGRYERATFAGGCFWCMEPPFEKMEGVTEVISGYAGGDSPDPTYKDVSSGTTGHLEVVQVLYDPAKVSYGELLHIFWRQIDPTDRTGSFVDKGPQYGSAIFFHNERQREEAEKSKEELSRSGRYDKPIVTSILPLKKFYPAEEYHQDYYKKNPLRYKYYRGGSGRDNYLKRIWGKEGKSKRSFQRPPDNVLKAKLTPLQYKVTRKNGTERAFNNEYWNSKEEGIYVDIVSGEPLFSSTDKFKSGTGWPSFTRPLERENIVEKSDRSLFVKRTEVRSKGADSHLGHLFSDGPPPTGLRYCINSASLRFVSKDDLKAEGYGKYLKLFKQP